ncbi:F-box only protein 21-like isoform X2 [Daphnia pulex]|uniref:F-box only protein 21-like isoform X2 n=1 Tax=Daphnia pulex TaxID=6669 RepID=UPI001EDF9495|nr:F-box only protein 21-like isoform X2 [Daphnia pulex]
MDLLSLPNEILLNHVFSRSFLTITDLNNLMRSCHGLNSLIRHSNDLWRKKFINRWGKNCYKQEEKNEVIWMKMVALRLNLAQEVKETVGMMSSVCYPLGEMALPMGPVNKWIISAHPIPNFVEAELCQLLSKSEMNDNLALNYYAKALSESFWMKKLDQQWKDYLSQPECQNSLLGGAVLFSQCIQGNYLCSRNVEPLMKITTERVKQLVAEMGNSAPALKTYPASYMRNAKKILLTINKVMFEEMGFSCSKENEDWFLINYQIEKVLENRTGSAILISIVYQEVARMMGLQCEPIDCGGQILLRFRECCENVDSNYYLIDVREGGSLIPSTPAIMGQPVVSAECIFQRILKAPITTYQEFFDDFDFLEKNSLKFFRLASVISPRVTRFVLDYGKLSASFGIHLDDTIQLLQSAGLHGDPVMADCITKRREQYAEISLAKIVCPRLPSIKYAVGLVCHYSYIACGFKKSQPCVIVSWDAKFQKSEEWLTWPSTKNLDQPYYRILGPKIEYGKLYVAQETLELHPVGVAIQHEELCIHFERFDGRRYLPNTEKKAQYPEDEDVAISLIKSLDDQN